MLDSKNRNNRPRPWGDTMIGPRFRLGTMALLLGLVTLSAWAAPAIAADPPNVLFIAVDDLRPEFGAYGASHVKSPHLDRLARSGVTFLRAYCQQAVCSPSRSSLMTGTRPDTTKVWDLATHFRTAMPNVVTLGQHFKNHGYFVQGMGKIYHGGFDDAETWSVPWQSPEASSYALAENKTLLEPTKLGKGRAKSPTGKRPRGPAFEAADVDDDTFRDGIVAELAVATLAQLKTRNEPFFLAVGFAKPHLPFVAPKRYWELYDSAKIELATNPFRPQDAPAYAIVPGGELRSYQGIPQGSLPDDLARQLKHGYYAALSYMDAQLGRVLDELARQGLDQNTLVVLWGDHGWKLGEHGAWCKHSTCENDTNAPLLVSAPGMKHAGAKTRGLVEFVDIYPTLCELANLPLPAHLEGTSFKPLLDDPQQPWKRAAFSQYPRKTPEGDLMGYSMRTERYRFTAWTLRDDPSRVVARELYDLEVDPQENVNLANLAEFQNLVEELQSQWRQGWQAAGPNQTEDR